MAGGEDQPQQVVADRVVERGLEVGRRRVLRRLHVVADLLVLPIEHPAAPEVIDGAVLGRRHEPGARVPRNARPGPLLERGDERVVRQVFRQVDVAHDAGQRGDQLRRFNAPDGVNRAAACPVASTDTQSAGPVPGCKCEMPNTVQYESETARSYRPQATGSSSAAVQLADRAAPRCCRSAPVGSARRARRPRRDRARRSGRTRRAVPWFRQTVRR